MVSRVSRAIQHDTFLLILRLFVPENKHLFVQHIHLIGFACLISAMSACAQNDLKHRHCWLFLSRACCLLLATAGVNFYFTQLLLSFCPSAKSRLAPRLWSVLAPTWRHISWRRCRLALMWSVVWTCLRPPNSWNGLWLRGRASVRFGVRGVTTAAVHSKRACDVSNSGRNLERILLFIVNKTLWEKWTPVVLALAHTCTLDVLLKHSVLSWTQHCTCSMWVTALRHWCRIALLLFYLLCNERV